MKITSYSSLSERVQTKLTREGSRFIGIGFPVTAGQLQKEIKELRDNYTDATHVVYGSRTLENDRTADRYDNHGEPSGTAGEPVLEVLKGRDLVNTCICVVRYFGGTKLGTGGLVRAYGDSARQVLKEGTVKTQTVDRKLAVEYPHEATGSVMQIVNLLDGELLDVKYQERPTALISLPCAQIPQFRDRIAQATSGDFILQEAEDQ